MQIKKYRAATLPEAMAQIRLELGEDAVILKTERVTGRTKSATLLEVTAATMDRAVPPIRSGLNYRAREVQELVKRRPAGSPAITLPSQEGEQRVSDEQQSIRSLRSELEGLRGTVRELADQLKAAKRPDLPAPLAEIAVALTTSGVEENDCNEWLEECLREFPDANRVDITQLHAWWIDRLASVLPVSTISYEHSGQVVYLIGPTGVGKTTTLAKFATHHRFWGRRRVALCSIDTFRVAAMEQLKVFADIANLPLSIAFTPDELKEHVDRYRNTGYDAVFIDTPGRSPVDGSALPDLVEFNRAVPGDETILLLSGSNGLADLITQFDRYRELSLTRIVAAKLDETSQPGRWLSFAKRTARSLSYWTIGQNVPDDIIVSDARLLVRGVLSQDLYAELRTARFRPHAG